jgi:hypothetical protein
MPNLRASTKEQKADRAKGSLQQFGFICQKNKINSLDLNF